MEFVSRGLMLGEFHPKSDVGSVHNPDFPVMRSPSPMFAVRALSVHDLLFLDRDEFAAADRIRYLEHYLHYLSDLLSSKARADVDRRIAAVKTAAWSEE
jgi:hypothetical protein